LLEQLLCDLWSSLHAVKTDDGPSSPTADEMRLMQGTPPSADRLVTLENWITPPFNRWGLQHLQELVPCAPIPAAPTTWHLSRADRDLGSLTIELAGRARTVEDLLDEQSTDGIVVLHRGEVVWERYANGMEPSTRHVCFSVSKSVVATVAGILVGRGELDPRTPITEVVPELAGTSWEGATVQQLLDMRTGTAFSEVYAEVGGDTDIFGQVIGWFPRTEPSAPLDTYTYLAGLPADRPHGGPFEYRTPLTSMLGWVCERASGERLPALIGRELWTPMGAEFDASLAVDAIGTGFVGGGFNASLRDMARFGELWRRGGALPDGTQLVPAAWVQDSLTGAADSRQAWLDGPQFETDPLFPDAFYRNKWWIYDPARPLYSAIGIHGQYVTIDGTAEMVVARFSSLPVADDEADDRTHMALVATFADALAG
jgi:CubicO group peptidase (beta-lactamase class C family)